MLLSIVNITVGIIIVSPILFTLTHSFMTQGEIFQFPPRIFSKKCI